MERLIILSDLWGKEKSAWVAGYVEILKEYYDIAYYDCCDLGSVDKSDLTGEKLHQQFLDGGIGIAVDALIRKEREPINVLGFSIGGYIAWKAALAGLNIRSLTAISSTRLRYESKKPSGLIELFYGEQDKFKPDDDWFRKLGLEKNVYRGEEHELYTKEEITTDLCGKIIKRIKPDL